MLRVVATTKSGASYVFRIFGESGDNRVYVHSHGSTAGDIEIPDKLGMLKGDMAYSIKVGYPIYFRHRKVGTSVLSELKMRTTTPVTCISVQDILGVGPINIVKSFDFTID